MRPVVVGGWPHLISVDEWPLIEAHRSMNKLDAEFEVLERLAAGDNPHEISGLITINEAGVKARHTFELLAKIFEEPTFRPEPKQKHWTPGQGAPIRRGRHK